MTLRNSCSSPPPSPLSSGRLSPTPSMRSISQLTNFFDKLRRPSWSAAAKARTMGRERIESSSGSQPITHWELRGDGVLSAKRVPLALDVMFECRDGVDVVKLLRLVRADLLEDAQALGADVLVDEQWSSQICPRHESRAFKVCIRYSASAARSSRRDPQRPVALERACAVPGLMTILDRHES